jgi:hypothetical protein
LKLNGKVLLRGLNSNELNNEDHYEEYILSELVKLPKDELVRLAKFAFYYPTPQKRHGFRYLHAFKQGQENENPKKFDLSDFLKPKRFRANF